MTVKVGATFDGPGGTQLSGARKQTVNGIGDVLLYPIMLGWTNGADLKYDVRLGIYCPTGQFKQGNLANIGKNYWTAEPEVTFSWLSSKIGTEFNTGNDVSHYHTGDQFHFDGTLAQHLPLGKGFIGVGANGYYYKQFTGDSGSGARLGSLEGETIGVGPVISCAYQAGKLDLVAEVKWLHEMKVSNRLEGDYDWFKLGIVF